MCIYICNEEPLFHWGWSLLQGKFESCILTQMWISVITRPWILVSCKKQIWVSAYHSLIAVRASKLERGLKTISEYAPDMRIHFIYLCSLKSNMVYNYCIYIYIYNEEPLFHWGWSLLQGKFESCILTQMWISTITRPWILVSCKKQIWVSAYHSLIAVRASKLERGLKTSPNTPQICGYILFIYAV